MRVLTDVLAEQAEEAVREAGALLTDPAAVQTILSKSPTKETTPPSTPAVLFGFSIRWTAPPI